MGQMPLTFKPIPGLVRPMWFSFDPLADDKELWEIEREVTADLERLERKHAETTPLGKPENDSFLDEDDDDDDDDDDELNEDEEESDSHNDDDVGNIDEVNNANEVEDVDDNDSISFYPESPTPPSSST